MWGISRLAPMLAFELNRAGHMGRRPRLARQRDRGVGCGGIPSRQDDRQPAQTRAASTFVAFGIYQATRNPMYLGMLLILVAWAAFFRNAAALVVAPLFVAYMNRVQIEPEERVLLARFGDQFTATNPKNTAFSQRGKTRRPLRERNS